MAGESVRLFLSCVSDEFGAYRDSLRGALTRPNVEVKIQEDFKALGGDTLHMLEDYIARCEAVVHFLGDMTGSSPATFSVEDLLKRRPGLEEELARTGLKRDDLGALSYTQWEAWLAVGLGKKLLIVEPAPGVERGEKFAATAESRGAQEAHKARLKAIDRYPIPPFTSADNLVAKIVTSAVIDALVMARDIQIREGTFALGPPEGAVTEPASNGCRSLTPSRTARRTCSASCAGTTGSSRRSTAVTKTCAKFSPGPRAARRRRPRVSSRGKAARARRASPPRRRRPCATGAGWPGFCRASPMRSISPSPTGACFSSSTTPRSSPNARPRS